MALLVLVLNIVLLDETFANFVGLTFNECSDSLCQGKEPDYPPLESRNISSRVECLVRCLNNDFCNFVGHEGYVCTLYTTPNLANDMRASNVLWRFWTRPHPCDNFPCLNYACCRQHLDSFICLCTIQYTGKRCEKKVDCNSSPCQNAASCTMSSGDFECHCSPGFSGDLCQYTD